MGKTVDGSVTLVLQVCPASVVTRAAWPMSEPLMMLSMSPTIATQNVVPLTHETGWTAGPSAMPWARLSDNATLVQSVPDRAARAGVARPIVTAMDAPAASAPTAQLGLFASLISSFLTNRGNGEAIVGRRIIRRLGVRRNSGGCTRPW